MHYLMWTLLPLLYAAYVPSCYRYVTFSLMFIITYSALIGLQYGVGADYESYTGFINNDQIERFYQKGEYLSYLLMYVAKILSHANFYFLFVGIIVSVSSCVLAKIMQGDNFQNLLVIITSWTILFSAYNTTRQCLSVCAISIIFIWIFKKEKTTGYVKWNFLGYAKSLSALGASMFHASAPLIYPLYLLTSIRGLRYFSILLLCIAFLQIEKLIGIVFGSSPLFI
ncbi:EpsG family protein, partial [Planktomarina temperata]|nr:EpsG family protein [Planktomarina temperata]